MRFIVLVLSLFLFGCGVEDCSLQDNALNSVVDKCEEGIEMPFVSPDAFVYDFDEEPKAIELNVVIDPCDTNSEDVTQECEEPRLEYEYEDNYLTAMIQYMLFGDEAAN